MERRTFLAAGIGTAVGGSLLADTGSTGALPADWPVQDDLRGLFPRLARETYISAAAGMPLGTFAERGLNRYLDFQQLGPGDGRREYVGEMLTGVRGMFADLIGARPAEIALVQSTKAGEQIVIDGLDPMASGRNVVTNDLHFSGSLHNLIGLRRAGLDVRIVRARDWDVSVDDMARAIDDDTALVAVTLLSNVNGRIESMRELAEVAHAHGALVYADVIQAAGIMPFDVRELGIDFAAANGYKWLFGVHGTGFLYVRDDLQGTALPDRLFPGNVGFNYEPWVTEPESSADAYSYRPPSDASRYQPGHVSYLGYSAVYEGLRFIERVRLATAFQHSVRLARRLQDQLDPNRYPCITPEGTESPIITFLTDDAAGLEQALRAAKVVVTLAGNRVRVSPAVYNDESDIDLLAETMAAA